MTDEHPDHANAIALPPLVYLAFFALGMGFNYVRRYTLLLTQGRLKPRPRAVAQGLPGCTEQTEQHYGTGPEIWEQMEHRLDAVVCGVGTGGTLTGLSRYFSCVAPHVNMVLADPKGSVLADYVSVGTLGQAGSWLVEGIGEDSYTILWKGGPYVHIFPPTFTEGNVSIPDREEKFGLNVYRKK